MIPLYQKIDKYVKNFFFEILVQTALILGNLEINPKVCITVLNYTVVLSQIQICPLLAKKGTFLKLISTSFLSFVEYTVSIHTQK